MKHRAATVNFEQNGSQLNAVEIDHSSSSPRVPALHGALFALGIVICTYQVRASAEGYFERVVIARLDGGAIEGKLLEDTRAAFLPITVNDEVLHDEIIAPHGFVAT